MIGNLIVLALLPFLAVLIGMMWERYFLEDHYKYFNQQRTKEDDERFNKKVNSDD